jgi:hypothetical protein
MQLRVHHSAGVVQGSGHDGICSVQRAQNRKARYGPQQRGPGTGRGQSGRLCGGALVNLCLKARLAGWGDGGVEGRRAIGREERLEDR